MDHSDWLSACESLVLIRMRTRCICFGLQHVRGLSRHCVPAGRFHFLGDIIAAMPHLIFKWHDQDLMKQILQAAILADIGDSGVALLHQILECGSQPNESMSGFFRFDDKTPYDGRRDAGQCLRTHWEAWVSAMFILQQQSNRVVQMASEERNTELQAAHQRKTTWADITKLLLKYGAGLYCKPCIVDHPVESIDDQRCRHVDLSALLEQILPGGSIATLRRIQFPYVGALRRNQLWRAMRSFLTSERNFITKLRNAGLSPDEQIHVFSSWFPDNEDFLRYIMDVPGSFSPNDKCNRCLRRFDPGGLVAWCIICEALSIFCMQCSTRVPFEAPALEHLYDETPDLMLKKSHTSIITAVGMPATYFGRPGMALRLLKLRHNGAQALVVLQEWYAKNRLETTVPYENALQLPASTSAPRRPHRTIQEGFGE